MSSLTAVKAAIDLINWESADLAKIKKGVDDLLDSIDADLEEVAFDESSTTEQFYGKLRKLLDEEDMKLMDEEGEEGDEDEDEDEVVEEGEDDDEEDDIEYEDDVETEEVKDPVKE